MGNLIKHLDLRGPSDWNAQEQAVLARKRELAEIEQLKDDAQCLADAAVIVPVVALIVVGVILLAGGATSP